MPERLIQHDLQQFYHYLQSERRYSSHTLSAYRRDINKFMVCSGLDETQTSNWEAIKQQTIRECVASLHRKGLSGKSLQRWLSSIRSLFNYLCRFQLANHNPAVGVPAPKVAKRLPKTLNVDEINQLLNVDSQYARLLSEHDSNPKAVIERVLIARDIAMTELLYASGLRLSELSGVDIRDINRQQQSISVLGKGKKQRTIPFGKKAKIAINTWLKQRGLLANDNEPALFVSMRGTRLSNSNIQKRLKQLAIKQGLNTNVYPHVLRHSFATHILESSKDLRAVQELLGHANLSSTQIYTHLDFQHLAGVYDKAHPRARKK